MKHRSLVFIAILLTGSIAGARTPQQLKTEMDNVLPAGMKVRMVWTNVLVSGGPYTAYAYDSEENVIRELTPSSIFPNGRRNSADAYISQDGNYVVLKDKDSDYLQKINFDGTDLRMLSTRGTVVCTWEDPADKTQYLVASGLPSPNNSGTWAIGIADPTRRRQISTDVFPKTTSQWGFGSGLSVDGKMVGGFNNDRPGLWPTPSGAFIPAKPSPEGDCQGCNFAMRPATGAGVYEYGHFHESHRHVCVHSADGTYKQTLTMGCHVSDGEAHGLYWTNHVDYVTAVLEGGVPNPVLFDLARRRCVALQENACSGSTCSYQRPNAVLLSKAQVHVHSPVGTGMTRSSGFSHAPRKLYSIEGRLLHKSQFGAATPSAVRSLRIPDGNRGVGIVVGRR